MASNPWVIDTPVPVGVVLWEPDLPKVQVEYVGYTSASDSVEVLSRYGKLVARLSGASDLRTVRTGRIGWVQGFTVPVTNSSGAANMASGKLIVYFE
jgi:hypothetical protein